MTYPCDVGGQHGHPTEAVAAACTAEFYAWAEAEARRFDNAVPPQFFRDSESPHLAAWFSER
jgi:hypothetical protein